LEQSSEIMVTFKVPTTPAALADNSIEGFKVLEWKIRDESSPIRHFFIKEHRSRGESSMLKPNGRTLIVMNIPPIVTKEALMSMFSVFGKVQDVFVHQNPTITLPEEEDVFFPLQKNMITGYRMAYIVFQLATNVVYLLKLKSTEIPPLILGKTETGIKRWVSIYNSRLQDVTKLENHVKTFMLQYEQAELRKIEAEKNNEGKPDEDGWITVSRKGKRPGTARTEKTEERLKMKKRRQEKELMNFTPSQIKESRANQLVELKKKFDDDKQRVALLRQQRKFRPF